MAGYIAVHVGAGEHSVSSHPVYKHWMKEACRKGQSILSSGGSAVDAVAAAIQVLESCEITNAGYGSVLTKKGTVECDAGIMEGSTLRHAGVGAVSGIKHPITVAHKLLTMQSKPLVGNLVPPALLVGEGAVDWAAANGIRVCDESKLVSAKSLERHRYYLRQLRKLKHRQKREKLTLPKNSLNSRSANDAKIQPSNTEKNVISISNATLSKDVNKRENFPETTCNGLSSVTESAINEQEAADYGPKEDSVNEVNCSVHDTPEKKLPGRGRSYSSMETEEDLAPEAGLDVHQGDSSTPTLINEEKRENFTYFRVRSQPCKKLAVTCKCNLKCRTYTNNLNGCEKKQKRGEEKKFSLPKSAADENGKTIQEDKLRPCEKNKAGQDHAERLNNNTSSHQKRAADEAEFASCRTKKSKNDSTSISPSVDLETKSQPTVSKSLQTVLDTVGCVAVGADGTVAAGASSGGILLKTPGRVGQSAILGGGYWAENRCRESRYNIAVCTSGCGEMLVSSMLAMRAAAAVAEQAEADWADLPGPLNAVMLESKFLQSYSRPRSSGCLILKHDPTVGLTDLFCCHSSISFGYAYMGVEDRKPTAVFSSMSRRQEGQEVIMNCYSYLPRSCAEPKPDGLPDSAMIPTWRILDPNYSSGQSTNAPQEETSSVTQS